jgi:drug/metabolite transporter (DMT)-like permease
VPPNPASPPHIAPTLAGLFAALSFGITTPLSKGLLEECGPLGLSGLLYAGAAMAVAPWAAKDWPRRIDRRNAVRLGGAVVFGGVVGPVLLLIGLASSSATEVSLWLNLETVATAMLARCCFREQLSGRTWVSVGLVIAGSALLTSGRLEVAWAGAWVVPACVAWGLDKI